ncbi:MAG: aldose 1-epimerase family protein [Clostridia bacterium]
MKIYKIENDKFIVKVKEFGAELTSMFSKEFNREYIWQGDDTFPRQACNLFPNCGAIVGNEIKIDGKAFPAKQHGFARDNNFELAENTDTFLSLVLKPNDATRKVYPYDFEFYINFELVGDKLKQTYKVVNKNNVEMQFGVGAHTGFKLPIVEGEDSSDYSLDFGKNKLNYLPTQQGTPYMLGSKEPFKARCGKYPLNDETFANGSFILDGFTDRQIKLFSKKSKNYVLVEFADFANCVIWCKEGKLKYICIEPWNGLPDLYNSNQDFTKKVGNIVLKAGETFACDQYFSVGKN